MVGADAVSSQYWVSFLLATATLSSPAGNICRILFCAFDIPSLAHRRDVDLTLRL